MLPHNILPQRLDSAEDTIKYIKYWGYTINTESQGASVYLCLSAGHQVKAPVAHLRGALVSLHSLGGELIMADHESSTYFMTHLDISKKKLNASRYF